MKTHVDVPYPNLPPNAPVVPHMELIASDLARKNCKE
jgi:hypothetical protein